MKKTLVIVCMSLILASLCGLATATEVFKARGSAVVTGLHGVYQSASRIETFRLYVSNISSGNVTCKITVYNHNGTDVTQYSGIYTGSDSTSGLTEIASGTGEFVMPKQSSRYYQFVNPSLPGYNLCHAVIEWTSDDPVIRKALIASAKTIQVWDGTTVVSQFSINGGELF